MSRTDRDTVMIVDQTLEVLRRLADSGTPRGVRELARETEVSKSSVQRILASLEAFGLAAYDEESRKYAIGPGALSLAWQYSTHSDLVGAARPELERLRAESGESTSISTIIGADRVTIVEAESFEPLRFGTGVGRPYPLVTGATARVLLSLLDSTRMGDLLDQQEWREITDQTITDPVEFHERIQLVRERGYEISRGEWVTGAVGLAVPVGLKGDAPFALSLYGPDVRIRPWHVEELIESMRETAERIWGRWQPTDGEPRTRGDRP